MWQDNWQWSDRCPLLLGQGHGYIFIFTQSNSVPSILILSFHTSKLNFLNVDVVCVSILIVFTLKKTFLSCTLISEFKRLYTHGVAATHALTHTCCHDLLLSFLNTNFLTLFWALMLKSWKVHLAVCSNFRIFYFMK